MRTGRLKYKNPEPILFESFPFPVLKFVVSHPRRDTTKLTPPGVYLSLVD